LHKTCSIIHVLFIVGAISLAPPLHADTILTLTPRITVREKYDDNLDLSANNPVSDWVTTILPGADFNLQGEHTNFNLDLEGGWALYRKDSSRDTRRYRGSVRWDHQLTKFLSFNLNDTISYTDDPITVIDGEVVDIRGGRSAQYRNDGQASLSYAFGANDRISGGYSNMYIDDRDEANDDRRSHKGFVNLDKWFGDRFGVGLDTSYTNGTFEIRDDFQQYQAGLTTYYRWNPYRYAYARYSLLDHSYDEDPFYTLRNDYQVHQGVVGINLTLSPHTELYLDAGHFIQQYHSDYSDDQDGPVFNASFSTRRERTTWRIEASGGYDEDYFSSDDFGSSRFAKGLGRVDYRLTETLRIFGSFDYRWDDYYDADVKEDRIRATGGLNYEFWRWYTASLQYTYNQRESDQSSRDYVNNRIEFQVRWGYPVAF
jgi:hypothetical protein